MSRNDFILPVFWSWYESLKQYTSRIALSLGIYTIALCVQYVVNPWLIKNFFDTLKQSPETALYWLMGMFAANIIYSGTWSVGDIFLVRDQPRFLRKLKDDGLASLLKLDHRFFTSIPLGGLIAKLKRYAKGVEHVYDEVTFSLLQIVMVLTSSFVVVFWYVPAIALFILLWAIVFMVVIGLRLKQQSIYDREAAEADSEMTAKLADIITNAPTVVAGAMQEREIEEFKDVTKQQEEKTYQSWRYAATQWIIQRALMAVLYIGVMTLAYWNSSQGVITLGTVVLLHTYIGYIMKAMFTFGRSINNIRRAMADAAEMTQVLDREPEIQDASDTERVPEQFPVAFSSVGFQYEDGTRVFSGFDLTIPEGQKVGVVGISGSGKTTVLRLLQRLYDPQEGAVKIGERDISQLELDELRSLISYVPQEPSLFDRTILENIRYFKPDASIADVREVARIAQIDDFVSSLSEGFHTYVGERGVKLSGGQRQRVAIARALLADRPIVVFDEASSALDNHTEYLLQEQLLDAFEGKTVIVIAHRLSTVRSLDRIVVLENGEVIEDAPHEELVEADGRYAQLWERHISA